MDSRVPFYARSTQAIKVIDLLASLRDGMLRVPRFERGFVWRDTQRIALLDSIYRGYPIGALLVWRTTGKTLAVSERVGDLAVHVPRGLSGDDKGSSADYLLDGLQRMTTLYAALAPALLATREGEATAEQLPRTRREGDAEIWEVSPGRTEWEIVFYPGSETFTKIPPDGRVPVGGVPLSVLLDTFLLQEFRRVSRIDTDRRIARRIDDLQARLRDYQVPVIPLLHPELRDAIESFRRLNTRGTRMQEADLLRALSWSDEFDLSLRLAPVRQKLAEVGWGEIEEDSLVDLCKLEVGLAPYSYAPERFGELVRKDVTVFNRVEEKILRAVGFLRDRCGVGGLLALPYAFQLVLLAHSLPPDVSDDEAVSARATEWFWKTTWTHYFASQRRISQAVKNLQAWLRGSSVPRLLDDDAVEAAGRFDFRRARDKALALLLLRRGGNTQERASRLGREGKKFLHPLVPDNRSRRMAAGNIVVAREDEIAALRARLLGVTGSRDPELLERHAIDATAHERLIAGDSEGFVRARLEHLRRLERAEVESLGLRYVVVDLPDEPGNDGPLFERGDDDDRD